MLILLYDKISITYLSRGRKGVIVMDQETKVQIVTEINVYVVIGRTVVNLILKALRFGLYLFVTFIEMFLKLIKAIFLNSYEPFQRIKVSKDNLLDKAASKKLDEYKVQYVSEHLSRHEYNFQRSNQFLAQYRYLQKELQDIANNNITIDTEIYRDIFKRISILVSEAENTALREGYNHARKTHYNLYSEAINEDYIRDKVLSGQSNTDWGDLKERLENE